MRPSFRLIFISAMVICAVSCGNHRTTSGSSPTAVQPDSTTTIDSAIEEEEDTVLLFRFLDFRHDGSKESFLLEAVKSDIFIPQNSSKVDKFLGADWGLNIKTDSLERVSEVILITSNTSGNIYKRACAELLPYLGEPCLIDEGEERIRWNSFCGKAYFRHLHSDEGGWIMMFNWDYPNLEDNDPIEWHKDAIKRFQEDVRSKDRERIASHFKFPFKIGYPLPDIKDKDDFSARYEPLFDKFIEEEITCSNDWCSWPGITRHSGHILSWNVDSSDNLIVNSLSLHPKAYYKALENEIDIQRQDLHPSLHKYRRPIVVARSKFYIFRIDEILPGELCLAIWRKGKTMKERSDYVNKHGFISQIGFSGRPDWMFVNEKDTVLVSYENLDNEAGYYHLKR